MLMECISIQHFTFSVGLFTETGVQDRPVDAFVWLRRLNRVPLENNWVSFISSGCARAFPVPCVALAFPFGKVAQPPHPAPDGCRFNVQKTGGEVKADTGADGRAVEHVSASWYGNAVIR